MCPWWWVCLRAYIDLLVADRMRVRRKEIRLRQELIEEGTYFPATRRKSKTTSALHYTLLLTTGGARSLRGTAERAAECMRQIIFIWDPGGY